MVQYIFNSFISFLVGASITFLLVFVILMIRYLIRHQGHLSIAEINVKVREIADSGFTTCTNPVHAMDIVNACPVKTRIQRINENLYNVREVHD